MDVLDLLLLVGSLKHWFDVLAATSLVLIICSPNAQCAGYNGWKFCLHQELLQNMFESNLVCQERAVGVGY